MKWIKKIRKTRLKINLSLQICFIGRLMIELNVYENIKSIKFRAINEI